MVALAAVMVNLLGTEITSGQPHGLDTALGINGARVHLYGKLISGPGRKMGHITVLEKSVEEALVIAERAAKQVYFGKEL
jgi:5-(carboxyamino)imidazole ribonucleotide synthase